MTVAQPVKIALPVTQNQKAERKSPLTPIFNLLYSLVVVICCQLFLLSQLAFCLPGSCWVQRQKLWAQLGESGMDQTLLVW